MVIDRLLEWCKEDLECSAFLFFLFFSEVTTCDQRIMAERNSVEILHHRIFRTATAICRVRCGGNVLAVVGTDFRNNVVNNSIFLCLIQETFCPVTFHSVWLRTELVYRIPSLTLLHVIRWTDIQYSYQNCDPHIIQSLDLKSFLCVDFNVCFCLPTRCSKKCGVVS